VVNSVPAGLPSKRVITTRLKKQLLGAGAAIVSMVLATGFMLWPKTPVNLGEDDHMNSAGVYEHWRAGDVIVLVRHAERCDRSSNPCLGPADGITHIGSIAAAEVGKAFKTIGMDNADVLSSPATRTLQTSSYMFGHAAPAQDWLVSCGKPLRDDALAHKAAHRNLVLVTHSECISDLESQLGFKHARSSEYTSSLFVSVTADGQLNVLGVMNEQDWAPTLKKIAK
jgi:phosphohistidine phosphatase SixA